MMTKKEQEAFKQRKREEERIAYMKRKQENPQQVTKEVNTAVIVVMGLFLLAVFGIDGCVRSCSDAAKKSSAKYSSEYWESVQMEKAYRNAGMDSHADAEKNARIKYHMPEK